MRIDADNRSRIADPNVEMYVAWFNTVKKVTFEYRPKIDKFEATTLFTKDMGASFLVAVNTCMIKERYIFCEFFHQPPADSAQTESGPKRQTPVLSVSKWNFEREYKEELDVFSDYFHDLHYNSVFDLAVSDAFYLFNPEAIVKISVPNVSQKVESLYMRKRFDEALQLSSDTY